MTRHRPDQDDGAESLTLADGDAAAAIGEWPRAVSIWEALRTGPDAAEVNRRFAWFLDENGVSASTTRQRSHARARASSLLTIAMTSAVFGTVAVLMGIGASGALQIVCSVVAWVAYAASAVLAVVFAQRVGIADRNAVPVDDETVDRAREIAVRTMQRQSPDAPGETVRR